MITRIVDKYTIYFFLTSLIGFPIIVSIVLKHIKKILNAKTKSFMENYILTVLIFFGYFKPNISRSITIQILLLTWILFVTIAHNIFFTKFTSLVIDSPYETKRTLAELVQFGYKFGLSQKRFNHYNNLSGRLYSADRFIANNIVLCKNTIDCLNHTLEYR